MVLPIGFTAGRILAAGGLGFPLRAMSEDANFAGTQPRFSNQSQVREFPDGNILLCVQFGNKPILMKTSKDLQTTYWTKTAWDNANTYHGDVYIDTSGDVYFAGTVFTTYRYIQVLKIDGSTGSRIWDYQYTKDFNNSYSNPRISGEGSYVAVGAADSPLYHCFILNASTGDIYSAFEVGNSSFPATRTIFKMYGGEIHRTNVGGRYFYAKSNLASTSSYEWNLPSVNEALSTSRRSMIIDGNYSYIADFGRGGTGRDGVLITRVYNQTSQGQTSSMSSCHLWSSSLNDDSYPAGLNISGSDLHFNMNHFEGSVSPQKRKSTIVTLNTSNLALDNSYEPYRYSFGGGEIYMDFETGGIRDALNNRYIVATQISNTAFALLALPFDGSGTVFSDLTDFDLDIDADVSSDINYTDLGSSSTSTQSSNLFVSFSGSKQSGPLTTANFTFGTDTLL